MVRSNNRCGDYNTDSPAFPLENCCQRMPYGNSDSRTETPLGENVHNVDKAIVS